MIYNYSELFENREMFSLDIFEFRLVSDSGRFLWYHFVNENNIPKFFWVLIQLSNNIDIYKT